MEIDLYENEEDIFTHNKIKRIFTHLKMNDVVKKAYGEIKKQEYLGQIGFALKLPVTETWLKEKPVIKEEFPYILERHLEVIGKNDIRICHLDKRITNNVNEIIGQLSIPYVKEKDLNVLLIPRVLEELSKFIAIDMKDLKVTLLCEDDLLSKLALSVIYPELNFLTIVTNKYETFISATQYIYEDTGLNIVLLQRNQTQSMENHIYINTSPYVDKIYHQFPRNAIIINLIDNKELEKQMVEKRKDIKIITNYSIKIKEQRIRKEIFEMILYICHRHCFRSLVFGYLHQMDVEKAMDILNSYDIRVDKFYFGKEIVKRKNIEKIK